MTKKKTDELLSTFEEMTMLELKEFLDAFEEKFDVTASAPTAVAVAPAAGEDGDADSGAEEKDEFDVVLTAAGSAKIQVPRMFWRASTRRLPRRPRRASRPSVVLWSSSS